MNVDHIRAAWSAETSYWPDKWTSENPASGQCAVTALVVQDMLGGDIWRGWVGFESHYWNFAAGKVIDITLEQFGRGNAVRRDVPVHRDVILRNEDTKRRYHLLAERVRTLGAANKPTLASTTEEVAAAVRQAIREEQSSSHATHPEAKGGEA